MIVCTISFHLWCMIVSIPDLSPFSYFNTVDRDLNPYKIVVPLFGAANAAPNKGTTILY